MSRQFLYSRRRPRPWIVLCLVLMGLLSGAASGCRTNPQVALLEMENRLLEDRIYQLEAQLAKQARQLASSQPPQSGAPFIPAETVVPAPQQATGSSSAISAPSPGPGPYSPPDGVRNNFPRSGSGLPPPNIEIPQESLPEGRLPRIFLPPQGTPPSPSPPPDGPSLNTPTLSGEPRTSAFSSPIEENSSPPTSTNFSIVGGMGNSFPGSPPRLVSGGGWAGGAASTQVRTVRIAPEATGPYNPDGQPGDEGITVGIVPLDAQGRLVPAAAPISMVVIDPAFSDESARVARWDFTAEQIAAVTQTIPPGEPLRVALVWPKQPPQHNRLHLFVRYVTADGRKLQADMPLEVDVQGRPLSLHPGSRGTTDSRNQAASAPQGGIPPGTLFAGASSIGSDGQPGHPPRGPEPPSSLRMASPAQPLGPENLPPQPVRQARIPWKPTR